MTPLWWFVTLSSVVFGIGAAGLIIRKNALVAFMCIELMLNATNLLFVVFSRAWGNLDGQIAVFFSMVIAAAEAAIGLALIIAIFRETRSIESTDSAQLKN